MCPQAVPEDDRSAPLIRPSAAWRVASVEALADYRLKVRFLDGTEGVVDMARLVRSAEAGIFSALADSSVFAQAHVEYGAVTWPGEIDLAPDAMYAAIRATGEWVLS